MEQDTLTNGYTNNLDWKTLKLNSNANITDSASVHLFNVYEKRATPIQL